jgi:hypothetical protein
MEEHDGAWQERYTPLTVISTAQLLGHAVNKPAGQWTKFDQSRMAAIMRRLAWKRTKMEDGTHSYLKPEY